MVIFLIVILGCNKQIEVKKISQTTCSDCSAVISSDTTTVFGLYNKTYKVLNTPEGKVYPVEILPNGQKITTKYKKSFCEDCKKKRRDEAKKLVNEGKRKYWAGRYEEALEKFESAIMRLSFEKYAEADEWIEKAKIKIHNKKEKRKEYAKREKQQTTTYKTNTITSQMNARINYGKKLQKQVKRGMKIDVYGKEYEIISLQWVGMEDDFIGWFRTTDDYQDIKELGFKHIQFLDGLQYFKSIIVY